MSGDLVGHVMDMLQLCAVPNSLMEQFTSKVGLHHTLPTLFARS